MGLISGLFGNASEVDAEQVENEFDEILIGGESIERAFKVIRDLIVFTNKRIVFVDKQGVSGKKTEYLSIPYRSVVRFSKESAGHFDLDCELKIWVSSQKDPIVKEFKSDENIHNVYRLLSEMTLK